MPYYPLYALLFLDTGLSEDRLLFAELALFLVRDVQIIVLALRIVGLLGFVDQAAKLGMGRGGDEHRRHDESC